MTFIYKDYFGLRERPFNVTPDPNFFYVNPLYQEAFASLLYGIQNRLGLMVVTGEAGTGKTTLLRRLMNNLKSEVQAVFIFNGQLGFDRRLRQIMANLGAKPIEENKWSVIDELHSYLLQQRRLGRIAALLIDEAQGLTERSLERLRLLSNLETDKEKLLQIVLVGQPEFEAKLNQPSLQQLKQRIAIHCRLEPLKATEVGPFIEYRLRTAGYTGAGIFGADAIQQVTAYSHGIPRLINIICDNALLLAYGGSKKKVSSEMVHEIARDLHLEPMPVSSDLRPRAPDTKKDSADEIDALNVELAKLKDEQISHKSERGERRLSGPLAAGLGILFPLFLLVTVLAVVDYPVQTGLLVADLSRAAEEILGLGAAPTEPNGEEFTELLGQQGVHPKEDSPEPSEEAEDAPWERVREDQTAEQANAQKSEAAADQTEGAEGTAAQAANKNTGDKAVKTQSKPTRQQAFAPFSYPTRALAAVAEKFYGPNRYLGIDLIKEFNPNAGIRAGGPLRLPPLDRDTLVRRQSDGSYRLILASFISRQEADRLAETVHAKGYSVVIKPRRIADDLLLHRVEITGLKNWNLIELAWTSARKNQWIPFNNGRQGDTS